MDLTLNSDQARMLLCIQKSILDNDPVSESKANRTDRESVQFLLQNDLIRNDRFRGLVLTKRGSTMVYQVKNSMQSAGKV